MITTQYIRTMAAYNAEMNRRIYRAADRLTPQQRHLNLGAFWRSVQGTLCHLLWGDLVWMSRFAGTAKPTTPLGKSHEFLLSYEALKQLRLETDDAISSWASDVDEVWLEGSETWYSAAADREVTATRTLLVTHLFNHQTHHRGQVHALLTPLGQETGDTDLFIVVPTVR